MWIVTVRGPATDTDEFAMPAGKLTIGQLTGNDIVLADEAAAREHAVLELVPETDSLYVADLGSSKGTFVNHERITHPTLLSSSDQIRIGQHVIRVFRRAADSQDVVTSQAESQPITRDLVLEALDEHAVLLLEVSERLNSITRLASALEGVSNLMGKALGVDQCHVLLAAQFSHSAERGVPASIAQQAIDERAVIAIPAIERRADHDLNQGTGTRGLRSTICAPVFVDQEVAALVVIHKPRRTARLLSPEDVSLAVAISHEVSLTIQRAQLIEKSQALKTLTTTDALTQVFGRDHFLALGEQELKRARQHQRPMSVIIADIDHFRQVNEFHSLAAGDEVIRAVAARCRLAVRQTDWVGRYGGDEIAIVALSDLRAACAIAERLRKQVAGSAIYTENGLVQVTISLGVASLGPTSADLASILTEAEAALRRAKLAGRDRVEPVVQDTGVAQ